MAIMKKLYIKMAFKPDWTDTASPRRLCDDNNYRSLDFQREKCQGS
jgi:hypothetical protein